jgi:hypothetical protein
MQRREFEVPNMLGATDHEIVLNELRQIAGVQHVELLGHAKHGVIEWDNPATWDEISRRLAQLGYRIEG